MTYHIIQPPFSLKFREMTRAQLQEYYAWFMDILPERIRQLERTVRDHPEFGSWTPDSTVESLESLGAWFATQIETRSKTADELEDVRARLTFPVDVPGDALTNRTLSLAMDIGMYFSQVMMKAVPSARWAQPLANKKFADYGQPVLMGFGRVPLNPVRILVALAYGIANGKQTGNRLRSLCETWAGMAR